MLNEKLTNTLKVCINCTQINTRTRSECEKIKVNVVGKVFLDL